MQVFKEAVQFSKGEKPGADEGSLPVAVTGSLDAESDRVRAPRRIVLNITAGVLAVADADDFGSLEMLELPTNPIALLSCNADLVLTKDGVGYLAATDLSVAIGTEAATAADLTTTPEESNVVDPVSLTASALAPDFEAHSASNASPAPLILPAGAKSLFLNASGSTETSEDASLTVSGTVELIWVDLG